MASAVDICNLALSNLGQRISINSISPANTPVEQHCAMLYPIARSAVLEARDWTFALTRSALAELSSSPTAHWEYAYAKPSDCRRIVRIFPEESTSDNDTLDYLLEGTSILTSQPAGEILYVRDIINTAEFSGLFNIALGWMLSSLLAGPLVLDVKIKEWADQKYLDALGNASTGDASQTRYNPRPAASWIQNR